MKLASPLDRQRALDWCAAALGAVQVLADHSQEHGGHASATYRLRTAAGFCYLKVHQSQPHWENEVHAYERWVGAFGCLAPRLLAVHAEAPLALVVSEVPGQIVGAARLTPAQARALWRACGAALPALHRLETGAGFGPCRRDGTSVEAGGQEAAAFIRQRFQRQWDEAIRGELLTAEEQATLQAAHALLPAFAGERPVPCHRDYCSANWLVSAEGALSGVIDFEFAHWDVRVADFARDPDWTWLRHPDWVEAFFEGYGYAPAPAEAQQLLVARAEYALGAIVWGHAHAFFGFEQEGREALAHLARRLR